MLRTHVTTSFSIACDVCEKDLPGHFNRDDAIAQATLLSWTLDNPEGPVGRCVCPSCQLAARDLELLINAANAERDASRITAATIWKPHPA